MVKMQIWYQSFIKHPQKSERNFRKPGLKNSSLCCSNYFWRLWRRGRSCFDWHLFQFNCTLCLEYYQLFTLPAVGPFWRETEAVIYRPDSFVILPEYFHVSLCELRISIDRSGIGYCWNNAEMNQEDPMSFILLFCCHVWMKCFFYELTREKLK